MIAWLSGLWSGGTATIEPATPRDAWRLAQLHGASFHRGWGEGEFEAMLSEVIDGGADTIVAWSWDRLSRNRRDTLRLIEIGQEHRVTIGLVKGSDIDMTTASGRLVADLLAGVARNEIDAFTEFGRSFGMIFQVRDDILDVIGTEAELGKPSGQDLAEGIYTLPVLLALADPEAGPELRPLLGQPLGQPERDKAREIVAASGAIADSVVVARRYADEAALAAASGPSPKLAAGFTTLAHSLVDDLPAA